jgi:flagellar motility protein MotE (MotC chaperone)
MSKIYDALQHLEAQRKAQEGGAPTDIGANPLDFQERPTQAVHQSAVAQNLLEQTAAVTRFGAELRRRMGEVGLNGVQGIFALADQLQRALATVSQPELDHAEADLDRVGERIRSLQDELRQLKAVKTDLEGFR